MSQDTENNFRCGMVSIVGRPNVGKSTLLNRILNEKIAIVSKVPQTTRHQIRGIYTDTRGQIIFVDTPGLHKPKDSLGQWMNVTSEDTMKEADCIVHLVDSSEPTGKEEEMVVSRLKEINVPIIVGLNKIDLKGKYVDQYIALWEKTKGQPINTLNSMTLLPLSSKTGFNTDKLLDILFGLLPKGPALYPSDTISDMPQKLAVADIIREKLLWVMREEVPHSLAVIVEEMTPRKEKLIYVRAVILVERESQKEIVIGKKGMVLKKVGTLARDELESLLQSKIFLDLYVKSEKNWRDNVSILKELGCGD